MPLGGLLPYDDEEERRRRLAMLTPPFNPSAPPALPTPAPPRPTLPPPSGIPGGERSSIPGVRASRPPTRAEDISEMKSAYVAGRPGRARSGLRGALEGLATGGLGGALFGGAYGAIDPEGFRAGQFERLERPQIMQRFAQEDQEAERQRRRRDAELDAELKRAQIDKMRQPVLPRPQAPLRGRPGDVFLDPGTRQPIASIPQEKKPPTAAELTVDPESGKSAEEIADDSYQARGGDDYVRSTLPASVRQILEKGTVIVKGKETEATAEEVEAAQRTLDAAIRRQRDTDLQYTRGSIRGRRVGGTRPAPKPAAKPQRGRNAISVKEAADLLK